MVHFGPGLENWLGQYIEDAMGQPLFSSDGHYRGGRLATEVNDGAAAECLADLENGYHFLSTGFGCP